MNYLIIMTLGFLSMLARLPFYVVAVILWPAHALCVVCMRVATACAKTEAK